jgi:hypothetical protein
MGMFRSMKKFWGDTLGSGSSRGDCFVNTPFRQNAPQAHFGNFGAETIIGEDVSGCSSHRVRQRTN